MATPSLLEDLWQPDIAVKLEPGTFRGLFQVSSQGPVDIDSSQEAEAEVEVEAEVGRDPDGLEGIDAGVIFDAWGEAGEEDDVPAPYFEDADDDVPPGQADVLANQIGLLDPDLSGFGATCLNGVKTEAHSAMEEMMNLSADQYNDGDYEDALSSFMETDSFKLLEKLRDEDPINADRLGEVAAIAEKEEDKMWGALKARDFVFNAAGTKGNPMAGRWARAVAKSPKLKQKYVAVGKGHVAQKAFRKKWASEEYDTYETEKAKTETRVQRWTKKGKYIALGRVAWFEGGGRAGQKASINIGLHALQMGSPWFKKDKRAKNIKFLYFEESFEEVFEEAWSLHQRWVSNTQAIAAPAAAAAAAPPAAAPPAPAPAPAVATAGAPLQAPAPAVAKAGAPAASAPAPAPAVSTAGAQAPAPEVAKVGAPELAPTTSAVAEVAKAAANAAAADDAPTPKKGKATTALDGESSGKRRRAASSGGGTASGGTGGTGGTGGLASKIAAAKKMKTSYCEVVASANTILTSVSKGADNAWKAIGATGSHVPVKTCLATVESTNNGDRFIAKTIRCDAIAKDKKLGDAGLEVALGDMLEKMTKPIGKLRAAVDKVNSHYDLENDVPSSQ